MKDDSLNDTQQIIVQDGPFKGMAITPSKEYKEMMAKLPSPKGGYCPRCDTVWCEPGKCNCESVGKQSYKILELSAFEREIWNLAVETAANNLKSSYPDHAAINAYCAATRSLKK